MSNCSCVYIDMDYDGPEFHKTTMPRARKEHRCGECGRTIMPLERYENINGVWEGDFSTYKTCLDCLSIRNEFFCEGYYYEMVLENLREHIFESRGEIPEDCILSLTPKAQEYVCDLIEQAWERYFKD